jgi:hypothetical protein
LKVFVAPAARVALDHVKTQWFDDVLAALPLPLRGLSVAPVGTASFVQCAPAGTSNETANPCHAEGAAFLTDNVPQ